MIGGSSSSGSSVAHSAAPAPARAANVSSTCHDGSWNSMVRGMSRRPRGEEGGELGIVAPDAVGDAEQDGPEPLPERPVRPGQPRHARRRVHPERPERAAALRLDREAEVGRGRRDPGGHLDRGGRAVIGVVQLDGVEATGVVGEESGGGEPLRIEARDPARVGEPAGPGVEVTRHRSVSDRSSGLVPRRCRAGRRPGRWRRGRPCERPRSSPAREARGRRRRRRQGSAR